MIRTNTFPLPIRDALRIALTYLSVSILWIYFSDRVVTLMTDDAATLTLMQTYKGLVFVVFSAVLIFILVQRALAATAQAAAALAAESRRYRQLFEVNPHPMMVYDLKTLAFLAVNDATINHYGYSREEFLRMGLHDIHPLQERPRLTENIARVASGLDAAGTWQHRKKDGQIILVEITSHTLGFDGRAAEMFHAHDITERKQAEAERERLKLAIEQTGEMVFITDPQGAIQYVNSAFERTTGYSRDEIIGQNPRVLKSGEHDASFYRNLWVTISRGETFKGQIVNRRKNNELYTEEATISPIRDESGKIVNYVAVKHDITDQLRLAAQYQQAQKMESVGRLAGGVAHDYNNMLSVIIGYTQLALLRTDPEHPVCKQLQEIMKAAQRSAAMTRQLLAFARQQTISPKILDINQIVESMLSMLHQLIGEDIDLLWKPGKVCWNIKLDPSQLDQILTNLCVNARDAIDDVGKITIETGVATFNQEYCAEHAVFLPGEFVLLAVSDDGCGMEAEILATIFEPFFTTKGMDKGTGLGLATVYGIVKQNKGFINVYSEPGNGTTIKIYLPTHGETISSNTNTLIAELPEGKGELVLLVDDEPTLVTLGRNMLEQLGYQAITANSPKTAIALAQQHAGQIDLLLTDVVMPEMNGRELSHQLQQLYPRLKTLYMSGYTANVIAHRGVLHSDVNFIQKPLFLDELARQIRLALDNAGKS